MRYTIRVGSTDYSVYFQHVGLSDHWDCKGMHEWRVCIKKPQSIRWFRYYTGSDCAELDDFLHCIHSDASAVLTYGDAQDEFIADCGYGADEDHAGRRAWRGCKQTHEKLVSLFGDDFNDWMEGMNF